MVGQREESSRVCRYSRVRRTSGSIGLGKGRASRNHQHTSRRAHRRAESEEGNGGETERERGVSLLNEGAREGFCGATRRDTWLGAGREWGQTEATTGGTNGERQRNQRAHVSLEIQNHTASSTVTDSPEKRPETSEVWV